MESLAKSGRRIFAALVPAMMILEREDRPEAVYLFVLLASYLLFLEVALFRRPIGKTALLIVACIDVLFVSWSFYVFGSDLLLVFYFLFLLHAMVELGKARGLVAALLGALSFVLVSLLGRPWEGGAWRFLALTLVAKPGVVALALFVVLRMRSLSRRRLEEENDELRKRAAASNEVLSTLSHEVRTPLTMIKASSDILLEERPGAINEMQRTLLDTVSSNTERLIGLVESILARIKVDSSWLQLDVREIDLRPLVKRIVHNMTPLFEQRGRSLRYVYPHMLSPVLADGNWIQQVLINLVHNAGKYTTADGRVLISIKENDECVVVTVSDDGGGIRTARKTDVFDRYYQENPYHDDSTSGAGLGLAIVKYVVEKHNGNVYVGSVPGMGSIFSFTLPVARRTQR